MRFRRYISILLVCACMAHTLLFVSASDISTENMDIIIHDSEKNEQINALLKMRSELALDYENNQAKIDQIDLQLQRSGLEDATSREIQNKLGVAIPAIDIPSTDEIRWTSRRLVVTYHGQHYELQIYEAIPNSTDSPLLETYAACVYQAKGVKAGIANAAKIVGVDALGGVVDKFSTSEELNVGVSIFNAFSSASEIVEGFRDSLSTSTVFDEVSGTAVVSFVVHMRYIFVKRYQAADYGNQALCYIGSSASYQVTSTSVVWEMGDTEPVDTHVVNHFSGTTYSPYYDDYYEPAAHYHEFKYYGISNFYFYHYLDSITFNLFETDLTFEIPSYVVYS